MALVLAGAMTISAASFSTVMADPVAVADGTYDGQLSVTGTKSGDTLNFYKVVEWVESGADNVAGWKATSDYASVLTKTELEKILGANGQTATNITPAIAAQLAAIARGKTPIQSGTTTTLDTTAADKGPGIYMVLVTPADPDTVYNPVFVSSDFNTDAAGTIAITAEYEDGTVKSSTTTLDKTAKTSEDAWDDAKWASTAIGDTVTFTVTTTIPCYGEAYQNPHFAVKDKLTDLTLVPGSVKVVEPALTKDTEYTVTEGTDNYTLNFEASYLKGIKTTPQQVKITYDAIVATTAPKHVNTEKNEVTTEFSHTPSSENDYSFKKDTTQHYTFTIDADTLGGDSTQSGKKTSELVKIGRDGNGDPITSERIYSEIGEREYNESPLAGATFKLYTDKDCKNEYIPKTTTGATGTALNIQSDGDGRMKIAGLDAGTYYLREEKAPTGYVKDTHVAKIEIEAITTPVTGVKEWTKDGVTWKTDAEYQAMSAAEQAGYKSFTYDTEVLSSYTVKVDGVVAGSYTFKNKGNDAEIDWTTTPPVELPHQFVNTEGVELPSTGGIGTTIFYIVGAILVLGAGVLLVTRRRMSSAN